MQSYFYKSKHETSFILNKKPVQTFFKIYFFNSLKLIFLNYFTGKIHGVGQRMDEKIRNVMRLEEKKQETKLTKISKTTTHIISRKKPNKFRTPKKILLIRKKKSIFSSRNFFSSWNAPRLTRDGHKKSPPESPTERSITTQKTTQIWTK